MRILVVDDNPEFSRMMGTLLKLLGYRCVLADNGADVPALAAYEQPNLILLDLILLGEDGLAVARRLRADPTTRDIPIVLLTGTSALGLRERAQQIGVTHVIFKPFDVNDLRQGIRRALHSGA